MCKFDILNNYHFLQWMSCSPGHYQYNDGSVSGYVRCCLHSYEFNEKIIIHFDSQKKSQQKKWEFNCVHQLTNHFFLYIHSLLRSKLYNALLFLPFIFCRFLFSSVILIWRLLLSLKWFSVHKTFWCLVTGFRRHCCRLLLLLCVFFFFFFLSFISMRFHTKHTHLANEKLWCMSTSFENHKKKHRPPKSYSSALMVRGVENEEFVVCLAIYIEQCVSHAFALGAQYHVCIHVCEWCGHYERLEN